MSSCQDKSHEVTQEEAEGWNVVLNIIKKHCMHIKVSKLNKFQNKYK